MPESNRGLPTPSVAFYKIFGLSNLFPKSARFSRYHLGHLSNNENHEVEILSGAFMMIRKSVLDQIGLLDESFFMYGEDIDLSYRIIKANYKNYYLADTSIIHYKGESTKKSSINYVFVFYRAMAIFAKKHFSNKNAQLFSWLINLAIYLRASFAVLTRTIKHVLLPIMDALIIVVGTSTFIDYYESEIKYSQGGSYPDEVEILGIPLITAIYLITLFINGAYSIPTKFSNLIKGVFSGSLIILITYSLLDESYRFSRAIVLFSILWSLFAIPTYRIILNLLQIRKFKKSTVQRVAIIGKKEELQRITSFLKNTLIQPEFITYINSDNVDDGFNYTGKIYQLKDIIEIYQINEAIFCSKDISSAEIINQMSILNNKKVDFKIAPAESLYIIGSNSIENSGEYYILGSNTLLKPINRRNKRLLDFSLSFILLLLFPIVLLFNHLKIISLKNLVLILIGRLSFVGFINSSAIAKQQLNVKKGVLNAGDYYLEQELNVKSIEQLNFEYSRDYSIFKDIEIIFKNFSKLNRETHSN
ncbi:MAG: glycosyltransferase [Bacteroidetes bacterium]|nr:MAG: glycosyltransferase [Bacteroidota bacterium]